jgi:hypothetical protein
MGGCSEYNYQQYSLKTEIAKAILLWQLNKLNYVIFFSDKPSSGACESVWLFFAGFESLYLYHL